MTLLHTIGQSVRDALQAIPLGLVRGAILLALAGLLIWVIRLPRSETKPDNEVVDLRWGAAAALLIQMAIYAFV
jgi:uncharacterized iron-regulated membrane protein